MYAVGGSLDLQPLTVKKWFNRGFLCEREADIELCNSRDVKPEKSI
jgi:hypothetical protein